MDRRYVELTDREQNPTIVDLNEVVVVAYRKYSRITETVIVLASGYQISVLEAYQEVVNLIKEEWE